MKVRVALRLAEKQGYGSQILRDEALGEYYVAPLPELDYMDQRYLRVMHGLDQGTLKYLDYGSDSSVTDSIENL